MAPLSISDLELSQEAGLVKMLQCHGNGFPKAGFEGVDGGVRVRACPTASSGAPSLRFSLSKVLLPLSPLRDVAVDRLTHALLACERSSVPVALLLFSMRQSICVHPLARYC